MRKRYLTCPAQEDQDKDKDQLFMGVPESAAADYLDRLAKRI
jgi:hypothetical protein